MVERLSPYPDYKPSGVAGLRSVPTHWGVCPLKRICRFAYGDSLTDGERHGQDVAVYGSNGIIGWHDSANTIGPTIVIGRKGSFGKVNYSPVQVFAIDTTFFVDRRYTDADIRWLSYLLGWLRLDTTSKDSAIPGLSREEAYVRVVPLPPQPEQVAITRFLERTTSTVDRCIRAKEKLIELLEEQKQAIIQQVVAGQIDVRTGKPYRAYKPSGVTWMGDVPAHWDIRPAKWHLREVDEHSVTGTEEMLSVSHLTGVTPRSEKNVTMFKAESNIGHKLCEPGDLIINTMWAWMGALGIAQQPGLVSPSYAVYRPKNDSALDRRYAEMMLRSAPLQSEYIMRSTGIRPSRLRLYPDTFLRIRLIAPPPEEQSAIIAFVASETARCDKASKLMTEEIAMLQEYGDRLVADVITGKLDVRQAAANLDESLTGGIGVSGDRDDPKPRGKMRDTALEATS